MSKVITISREFGSGGREIGFRLAEKLGIPFYDKEIISLAAEDSNIAEEAFHAMTRLLEGRSGLIMIMCRLIHFLRYMRCRYRIRYLWFSPR